MEPVVIASQSLNAGDRITAEQVEVLEQPEQWRPPGSIASVDKVVGSTSVGAVSAGEALTSTRLAGSSEQDSLVPPEMVGAFVPLPEPALASVITAGTRVDVIAIADGELLAADVPVLTTLRSPDSSGSVGVLVAVAPGDAERIATVFGDPLAGGGATVSIRGHE